MKRAKIMLIAIAIVATVGGALAFKAQKFADKNVFCATLRSGAITCVSSDFKTKENVGLTFTTPCSTWHDAIGLPVAAQTKYYTTTACGASFNAIVTTTNVP